MVEMRTLGVLEVRGSDGRELQSLLAQPKRLALLVYLALARPRQFHRRDAIVALFWPELDQDHARGALRVALRFLRRQLGENVLVSRTDEELGTNTEALRCDALAFEQACGTGQLEEALALYRGDFLEGVFIADASPDLERWMDAERARLRTCAARAAWQLTERHLGGGNPPLAADWARRAVELSPDDEEAQRRLITLLDRLGDRAGAVHAYAEFARRLAEDHEVEPSAETQALIRDIRLREAVSPPLAHPTPLTPVGSSGTAGPAPVDFRAVLGAETAPALALPGTGATTRWRRQRAAVAASIAGAVSLAVIAALWHPWRRPARAAAPVADVASVAVLPFKNLTGNPGDQYLSDGMTEEVIGQLAQVGGLKVISRTSTEALKNSHLTLRQIADTLGVRHVLEGSLRHAGHRIRVAVDLIDATTDAHVWTSSYDRDLTDVFAVQEEIARHVADSLVSTVGVRPPVGRVSRTAHPEAYAAYLGGRYLMYRRTRDGLRGAREQFQQAIAQDSAYAPAYAGLASVYLLWAVYVYPGIDFYEAEGRAVALADRAIALDSDLAEAYAIRGHAMARAWAPPEGIAVDFQRALELRPNSVDVHQWYGIFLSWRGRHDEALAEMQRAVSLDPLAPSVYIGLSFEALALRRYDMVEQESQRALALEPGLISAREHQALGDLLSDHADRCVTLSLGSYVGVRAMCLLSLGRPREATQIADSLRAAFTARTIDDSLFNPVLTARGLAEYYAWTGNVEESLGWLERAYALSPEGEQVFVIASGIYDKVRNDPRFETGLQRVRTQVYARVQRARFRAALK